MKRVNNKAPGPCTNITPLLHVCGELTAQRNGKPLIITLVTLFCERSPLLCCHSQCRVGSWGRLLFPITNQPVGTLFIPNCPALMQIHSWQKVRVCVCLLYPVRKEWDAAPIKWDPCFQCLKFVLGRAHLVLEGQGLSDVTGEAVDDNAARIRNLHYLLFDLGDGGLLWDHRQTLQHQHVLHRTGEECFKEKTTQSGGTKWICGERSCVAPQFSHTLRLHSLLYSSSLTTDLL